MGEFRRELATTDRDLSRVFERMANVGEIGLDTESSGPGLVHLRGKKSMLNVYRSRLTGLSLTAGDTSYYIPLEHRTGNLPPVFHPRLATALESYSADRNNRVWIHNLKHELEAITHGHGAFRAWMRALRARVLAGEDHAVRCTQVLCWMSEVKSSTLKKPFALKLLAKTHFDMDMSSFEEATGGRDFSQLTPEEGKDYACEDAEAALLLAGLAHPKLGPREADWYDNWETPFTFLLRDLESAGMGFDADIHMRTLEEMRGPLAELEAEWKWEAPARCSISSPQQLGALYRTGVWDASGVPRKATGPSTEAEYVRWQLDRCEAGSVGHTLARIKTEHATYAKLLSTYGTKLVDMAQQYGDGRVHGGFHQTGTATGRLSSSYPNLQNIPKRTPLGKLIRKSFVPEEGNVLVSADYSQIELRVLAHFCGAGRLFDGYGSGADVHQQTADDITRILREQTGIDLAITRDQGKTGNFAVIYGAGAKRVAKSLSLTVDTTKAFLEAHKKLHPRVYAWLDKAQKRGRTHGHVRTLAGRKRTVGSHDLAERMAELRAAGHRYPTSEAFRETWWLLGKEDRKAKNTPIQGSAGDLMKVGMLGVWRSEGASAGKMVCQIHDDLVLEVPERYAEETAAAVQGALEAAGPAMGLRVPLVAEPVTGNDWSAL